MGEDDIGPENWPVLSRLLDEALDLPLNDREDWLQSLPVEYSATVPLLRRLLLRASSLLETDDLILPALQSVDNSSEQRTRSVASGDSIGSWRLVRKLGVGGMAEVWLAERDGEDGVRRAALKLPHFSIRPDALFERIAREKRILDSLHHPHIARLIDAGLCASGRPYLALEYVEGTCLDEHCRINQLSPRQRLDLFLQIAGATAYAHTRLVIHRDLKPTNILVTGGGHPWLLDFGIAKLLEDGQTRDSRVTRSAGNALTLSYASPEQMGNRPLTVASDVYSLGVILYELLTGVSPYALKRESPGALENAILELEPPKPSAVVSHKALSRFLRGDLDTIILKSLRKNPSARYHSVDALADDLRRFQDNRPVLAQPDRRLYRLTKFLKRNRLVAAASFAIMVSLLAGSLVVAWQARAALEHQRCAEQVKSFLMSVFLDAHAYWSGRPLSALDLLNRARSRIGEFQVPIPQPVSTCSTFLPPAC